MDLHMPRITSTPVYDFHMRRVPPTASHDAYITLSLRTRIMPATHAIICTHETHDDVQDVRLAMMSRVDDVHADVHVEPSPVITSEAYERVMCSMLEPPTDIYTHGNTTHTNTTCISQHDLDMLYRSIYTHHIANITHAHIIIYTCGIDTPI